MAKAKSRSKQQGNLYAQYKNEQRWEKNRRKKLENLAKIHPNNAQIAEALKNIKYRRKTPKAPMWSHSAVHMAKLFKEFEPKFSLKELQKERVVFVGPPKENTSPVKESKDPKGYYSLATRAHNRVGELIWN
jgi:hypothetical protein